MNHPNRTLRVALLLFMAVGILAPLRAQGQPVDHAKRVVNLMNQGKFDEVAAQFNAQVAAAMNASQVQTVWSTIRGQAGYFDAFIDDRVATLADGMTVVLLGCQFEKSTLNIQLAFDTENKIAGLRFMARPAAQAVARPTSTRFKEEDVSIGSAPWTLPGTLSMPVGPVAGAIVLVHGSGPNDRDETLGPNKPFRDLAWGLADRGIAVLRYEKRTRQYPKQFAQIKDFTVREETTDDALLAVAALRARAGIDPKRVFVLGHSLGGTVAPRIAGSDPQLAGLVIMAGATRPLTQVTREQIAYLSESATSAAEQERAVQAVLGSAPASYWKDLDTYRPAEEAAKLSMPMLILQGERDYQVTMKDLQGWRDNLAGKPAVTIRTYPALNHLFMAGEGKSTAAEYLRPSQIPAAVIDDIANWIKSLPSR